jgi:hypothetical protein
MGFLPQVGIAYTGAIAVNAVFPMNLKPTKVVDLNVSFNLNVLHSDPKNWQTMAQIPITASFGDTQVYIPSQPPTFPVHAFDLQNMEITLTDEFGAFIEIPDNCSLLIHLVLLPQA